MVNYANGKIYKIVCNLTGLIYIGATCQKYLSKRLQKHIEGYKTWLKTKKKYMTSFQIIENGDFYIELIENFSCNDIYELKSKEKYHILNNGCVNQNVPNRTSKEYYEANHDKIIQQKKQYYEENKDKILEKKKTEKVKCECGFFGTKDHLVRHKRSKKHLDLMKLVSI